MGAEAAEEHRVRVPKGGASGLRTSRGVASGLCAASQPKVPRHTHTPWGMSDFA